METHLKDRTSYEDRIDRMIVEDCRRQEQYYLETLQTKSGENDAAKKASLYLHISSLEMMLRKLDWHDRRDSLIDNWMKEDEVKDEKLKQATTPRNILCDTCYNQMNEDLRTIDERNDKLDVLFFMRCPSGHLPMKVVYEDGNERKRTEYLCPECKHTMKVENLPAKKEVMKTRYSCSNCQHKEVDEYEFAKKDTPDPDYKKDLARFSLSGEALKEARSFKQWSINAESLMKDWKHKEEHQEEYEAVAQLEKLTIPQVKERLATALADTPYLNLVFEKPAIEKFVSLEFTVEEMETDNQRVSISNLQKLVKKTLIGTNWRLMSSGIDYRLGLLSGRLRAYESEQDLLKLVS